MVQMVECLSSKHGFLSSNSNIIKEKKRNEKKNKWQGMTVYHQKLGGAKEGPSLEPSDRALPVDTSISDSRPLEL
jgi:hypothetical protein